MTPPFRKPKIREIFELLIQYGTDTFLPCDLEDLHSKVRCMATTKASTWPIVGPWKVLKRPQTSARTQYQKNALKLELMRISDIAELEDLEAVLKVQKQRIKQRTSLSTSQSSFDADTDDDYEADEPLPSISSSQATLVAGSDHDAMVYQYSRMQSEEMQFRLLHLKPSSITESIIECHLEQLSLNESTPPYEALSYTWGTTKRKESILLDHYPFEVTPNLYLALQNFRHVKETRLLWVDAICIDQDSIEERNHQVQNMRAIYQQAIQVLVWLGPAWDSSRLAFDFLNICATEIAQYGRLVQSTLSSYPSHLYALQCLLQRE